MTSRFSHCSRPACPPPRRDVPPPAARPERPPPMKIVEMRITPIAIGDPPLPNAAGLHAPYALRTIVELVTDHGLTGLGEIPGGSATLALLRQMAEVVVDHDPWQLNAIKAALVAKMGDGGTSSLKNVRPWETPRINHVWSAIEVACFDLMGQSVDRPVVDLLGGVVRERVPYSAYLFFKYAGAGGALGFDVDPAAAGWAAARQAEALTPEGIVAQARGMIDAFGFESVKLKDGMARLRAAMPGMPFATNMCTTSYADIPGAVASGSEDIILTDHHFWGGLRATLELNRVAATFGRGLSMHSNSHAGISLAAMTHLAAATPMLTYACDTHYPWQSDELLVGGKLPIEDGCVRVSREPGLGIRLDRDALERLHQQYLACGLTDRDDEVEMRKVEPDWRFMPVRY